MLWRRRKSFSHIVAGLGNPGRQYEHTLHNAGYRVVEKLAAKTGEKKVRKRGSYLYAETAYGELKIALIQPLTFMNLSGKAIAESLRWYRLLPENLTVVYDDMDLEPGVIRLRPQGGSGGHRGVASVIENLGTDKFSRLRVGIGRPPSGVGVKSFVLGKTGTEEKTFSDAEDLAVEAILTLLTEGIEAAMNKYNA